MNAALGEPVFSFRAYGAEALSHSHDYHQLILPVAGCLELETTAGADRVDQGQGAVLSSGMRHSFRACGHNRFAVIDWPESEDSSLATLWDTARPHPYFTVDPALYHVLQFMILESGCREVDAALGRRWAGLLALALCDRMTREAPQSRRLAAALAYVRRHFREPVRPADIAAAINLSPGRLHALFRAGVGRTPMAYVLQLRLDHAACLLAGSELPIAAVALEAGFADQSALTRSFHRYRGLTPARYRRQCAAAGTDKNA